MFNIKSIKTFLILIIPAVIYLAGCSGEEQSKPKSMEEIQKEEGIPVVIQKVEPQKFVKYLTFFGKFRGIKETTVGAMIGGRIDKILVRPGDYVKKDQIIIEFPEDAPASKYQQAKAAYENSKKTYERMKALYEKGEISQAQFDGAETKYLVDKRNYETMKDMLHLDAPYDGIITEILVHEGDNVKAKKPLFTIAKLNKMKIRIWLSEKERMQVRKGMKVLATVAGKTFTGKVEDLSLSVDPMKQAFYADLIFNNSKGEIMAGTTADVKIITYENDNAITVPRNLVKPEGTKYFVFVKNGDKAKKQFVTIKNYNEIYYEIDSGLNPGDLLITQGSSRLTDGIKIKVVK